MNKTFGARLRQSRKALSKRQTDMANKIGVTSSAWSRWESGHTLPGFNELRSIALSFNLSLDYLVLGIDHHSPELISLAHQCKPLRQREVVKLVEFLEVRNEAG